MLIDTRDWRPEPEPEGDRPPAGAGARGLLGRVPWRGLAWPGAFAGLLVVAAEVDGFAGYAIFLVDIAVGSWRLDRWAQRLQFGRSGDSGAWY
jgi:hypothetical protein